MHDNLKLDGIVAPQQPEIPKAAMANTKPDTPESAQPKKSYVPTTQTGLQDYSYWWEYARKQAKKSPGDSKSFRRGRIWA